MLYSRREHRLNYMQLHVEIRRPVNLKQIYDQQITYLSGNQRRTHMVRFLYCSICFAVKK